MVFLFNKAKIYSYLIAVTTVVALFIVASNMDKGDMAIQVTTSNTLNIIENKVNVVK